MLRLVLAEGALLERILDQTYPVWNEGLSRQAYRQWNTAQRRTVWGRERLHRFALVDEQGDVVASAKRYRFDVRIGDRHGWMCGIGAVFTPEAHRGRGYASTLVERLVDDASREGALVAGLFSEIGTAFYERLGFVRVPIDEVTVNVTRANGSPATLVRAGVDRDYESICAMHAARSAAAMFVLRRDPDAFHYALTKKRLFAGLSSAGSRQIEFFVAEEGATAVAYVVLSQNQYGWTLEEAGDRDPAGARLGAILQVLVAREPATALPLIRAWWPAAFAVPPQLSLSRRTDPGDIFMMRSLADVTLPADSEEVFYWRSDYF
jgi:GNAT superfamily N-acetyltransferase